MNDKWDFNKSTLLWGLMNLLYVALAILFKIEVTNASLIIQGVLMIVTALILETFFKQKRTD